VCFDAQNLGTVPVVKLMRRLTVLPAGNLVEVERAVQLCLGFVGQ
jgi:hypothetical protein